VNETKATSGGLKYDAEKPGMDMLDTYFLQEMARVLDFGAKKYARNNWRSGIQFSRTIAAILRHVTAFNNGEDFDPETGISHIAHAAVNCQFLLWFTKNRREYDDRYRLVADGDGGCALSGLSGASSLRSGTKEPERVSDVFRGKNCLVQKAQREEGSKGRS
jgi:hypothetical protein